jgi:predicted DsbA family dithiol-disulfide isomerase
MKSDLDKMIDKYFPVVEVDWKPFEIDWNIPAVDWSVPELDWTKSNESDTIKKAANQHNSTP